jgi:hypothetical protein
VEAPVVVAETEVSFCKSILQLQSLHLLHMHSSFLFGTMTIDYMIKFLEPLSDSIFNYLYFNKRRCSESFLCV